MRVAIMAGPMDLAKSGAAGEGCARRPRADVVRDRGARPLRQLVRDGRRALARETDARPLALAEEAEEAAAADYEDAERQRRRRWSGGRGRRYRS